MLGEKWRSLADLWRTKQLQYTWLRALAGRYADFWQVTGYALDFALSTLNLENRELRERLMESYMILQPYSEVHDTLTRLKQSGFHLAILSNGTPAMLAAAVDNAGIAKLLNAVISVEEVNTYKPHPSVYELVCKRFDVEANLVCFVSSNGWDAHLRQGVRIPGVMV